MAHQDCLEPKQQQQDGEAGHEEALGLSALELRPEHEVVSCGLAGRAQPYGGLGRTFLRSTARVSSSSWLPFSMTDGESGPSRVSVARSAMPAATSRSTVARHEAQRLARVRKTRQRSRGRQRTPSRFIYHHRQLTVSLCLGVRGPGIAESRSVVSRVAS
jgi:hypothetical protein